MTQTILVPLDGSDLSEHALTVALGLAQQQDTELLLVRATPVVPPAATGTADMMTDYNWLESQELTTTFHEQTQAYLDGIAEQYAGHATIRTVGELGDPATLIVDVARDESADFILMSTRGHSGLTHLMLGSVTERVLHGAPCPVIALRDDKPIEQIAVALDGSRLSELALQPALNAANRLGAHLTLLHVVEKLDDEGAAYLERMVARAAEAGVPATTALLYGTPVNQILEYIRDHDVDMVVLSTHGRSGIKRWLYGSVSEKVLRHAPCAVMIVRPQDA